MSVSRTMVTGAALAVLLVGGTAFAEMPEHPGMMGEPMQPPPMMMEMMEHHGGMGMPWEHVEGRIAYLKAELKIDESQTAPWNAFADALRANLMAMKDMHQGMMQPGKPVTLLQGIEMHEKMMTSRLEMLRKVQAAVTPLYAILSDEQKKIADGLMKEMCGM